jgi:hypothetical protein
MNQDLTEGVYRSAELLACRIAGVQADILGVCDDRAAGVPFSELPSTVDDRRFEHEGRTPQISLTVTSELQSFTYLDGSQY